MPHRPTLCIAIGLLAALAGCSISHRRAGIPNVWHQEGVAFSKGVTSEQDVLDILGPPSHVLELHERTVYYYLLEDDYTKALTLIVFNWADTVANFDRAIFFFGADRKLEEFALSPPDALEKDL